MGTEGLTGAMTPIDWAILLVYFAFVVWLGVYFGKRQKTSDHYFLGNRSIPGWAVGISIFATIISSWAFLALPGKAFKDDTQYLMSVLSLPLAAFIAVRFLVPLFREKVRLSAYEYLERRFGLFARFYGNLAFILVHFFKMAMVLYLLCLAISGITGWPLIPLIVGIGVLTMVYTFFGGIEGVIWTDVVQGILLLGAGVVAAAFLLLSQPVGPVEVISAGYEAGKFKFIDFSQLGWKDPGPIALFLFGLNLYMTKYATDQTVVQRYLLSSSNEKAGRALYTSTWLMLVVWVVFIHIGALLWVYYQNSPGLLPELVAAKPDQVFAYFIGHQLPPGLTGLILAGLLAATMSTLSSDLNSLGSVLVDDFYNKIAHEATDSRRLLFSRASVFATGLLAVLLAISLIRIESMVDSAFWFMSIMSGGVMGLFFAGLFTRRISPVGIYIGLVAGVLFIGWATATSDPEWAESVPLWIPHFPMHVYWLGLVGNLVVFFVSLAASVILTPGYVAEEGLTVYGRSRTIEPVEVGAGARNAPLE